MRAPVFAESDNTPPALRTSCQKSALNMATGAYLTLNVY